MQYSNHSELSNIAMDWGMNQVCVWQCLTCDRTLSGPQTGAGTSFEIECRCLDVTSQSAISELEYLGSVRIEPSSNGSPFISVPVCTYLGGEATALCEGLTHWKLN